MNNTETASGYVIQALARGLDVLSIFHSPEDRYTLSEIARMAGLNTTTALRILRTLESRRFLVQHHDRRHYSLGPGARFADHQSTALSNGQGTEVLDLLDSFTEQRPHLSIAEMAEVLVGNPDATQELVDELVARGYLQKHPQSERYRLGLASVSRAYLALARMRVRNHALPILNDLVKQSNLDATLAVRVGYSAMYIVRLNAPEPWRGHTGVGRSVPLHATAVGKVLLAHVSEEGLINYVRMAKLESFTPNTITDEIVLRAQLEEIRSSDVALDVGEWMPDRSCVASCVRTEGGAVHAAIGLSGHNSLFQPGHRTELSRLVKAAGNQISFAMGYMRADV